MPNNVESRNTMKPESTKDHPTSKKAVSSAETEDSVLRYRPDISKWFIALIVASFFWIFIGVLGIIGWRMFWNSPVHPSFAMFGVVAFAAIIAFAIVLTLDYVTGNDLTFEFAGLNFTGTSGPVILWILAFSAVIAAFVFGGIKELVQSDAIPNPPIPELSSPAAPVTQR